MSVHQQPRKTEPRASDHRMRWKCPTGCARLVGVGHLVCGPCWRKVPRDLQREVYSAWRALQVGRDGAVERYEAARDAALTAVARDSR